MENLEVIYEDNHIIVVLKPQNILSQGDETGDKSLLEMVREYIIRLKDIQGLIKCSGNCLSWLVIVGL